MGPVVGIERLCGGVMAASGTAAPLSGPRSTGGGVTAPDNFILIAFVVVEFSGVADFDERFDLFGQTCIDRTLMLNFGVEFGAEEDGDVGDPQPNQEDDDRRHVQRP